MAKKRFMGKAVLAGLMAGSLVASVSACSSGASSDAATGDASDLSIGLVTKTDDNPFWVAIRDATEKAAEEADAEFTAAAGSFDGDIDGQVTAIENLMAQGINVLIVTPSNSTALNPIFKTARDQGILVIALDTEPDPLESVDAFYATDNMAGGVEIGKWATGMLAGADPVLAAVDGVEGSTVAAQRHDGFVEGMGLTEADVAIAENTDGSQDEGQTVMENILQAKSDVNVVYAINEPAARGAANAIKQAGKTGVILGTFDGSCSGVQAVQDGEIGATVLQYPSKMGELAVEAAVEWKETGTKPSGYIDSGSELITDTPVDGVESKDTAFGLENCWG
jgi:fructose transport system substrate-binding protein